MLLCTTAKLRKGTGLEVQVKSKSARQHLAKKSFAAPESATAGTTTAACMVLDLSRKNFQVQVKVTVSL